MDISKSLTRQYHFREMLLSMRSEKVTIHDDNAGKTVETQDNI